MKMKAVRYKDSSKKKSLSAVNGQRLLSQVFSLLLTALFFAQKTDGFRFCMHNDTSVQLIDNGYETVVIWISEDVPQDYQLITDLEELVFKLSSTLFQLTKRRAYIRNVEVLLPDTWGSPPQGFPRQISNKASNVEALSQSQIWLRNSSPRTEESLSGWRLGDQFADIVQPYVIKTTPCGFPGTYLRMSPEFVRFGDAVAAEIGPPEKVLAREWAKLRWGVYDETPRANDLSDYYLNSDLSIRPTICSSAIPGSNVDTITREPNCNVQNSLYDQSCSFEPSTETQTQTFASLLYRPDLSYVNAFCDDAELTTEEMSHDVEAPTTHNLHCRGRSIWSVMRDHPDFADGNNPPSDLAEPPATNFTLFQNLDRRVVLVLDVSTSMEMDGRLQLMHQAVSHYIDTVPLNTWVGLVCFGWQAQIKAPLTEVRRDDVRTFLKSRLVPSTMQGTSIGSGIMKGIEVLATSGPPQLRGRGGSIIILTDGREHNRPKINDTISQVRESGVRVSTIAFGSMVARDLEWLASVSGGSTHAASSGEFGIDSELQEAFLSHQENADVGAIPILSEEIVIARNSSVEQTFVIDNSVGTNTRITIFYNMTVEPEVLLESPGGEAYIGDEGEENVFFSHDETFKTINIRITGDAEVGSWKLYLENPIETDSMVLRVSVVSFQRNEDPIVASPALLCRSFDFTGDEAVVVYVYLSQGELAVLNAFVYAEITRPLSSSGIVDTRIVILRDSGLDPDVTANDGVYSAYFTSFTMMGRYNVKVYASDNNGQASIDPNYILGIGNLQTRIIRHDTRYLLPTPNPRSRRSSATRKRRALIGTRLPSFQRVSSAAGAFIVQEWQVDDICDDGYIHFQDACYKVHSSPVLSYDDSLSVCENEGGDLAVINSRQELAWLLARVTAVNVPNSGNAWFGGVDEELRSSGDLAIERIVTRVRRGMEDQDLNALAVLLGERQFSQDFINSFDPDIEDMSNPEINRLLSKLGLESISELLNARNLISRQSNNAPTRKKRQIPEGLSFPVAPSLKFSSIDESSTTAKTAPEDEYTTVTLLPDDENSTNAEGVTLSPAKREPDVPDPLSSGADIPTCSWFQNGRIIESTGDVCQNRRRFVCEKGIRDRFPPSRIVDLQGRLEVNNELLQLTWSAPGDDLNVGTATGYDIRTLRTRRAVKVLTADFERGDKIGNDAIISESITPGLAGDEEVVTVNISKNIACPPHAVLDVIIALPTDVFEPNQNEEKHQEVALFVDDILSKFRINEFEVQVAAFALNPSYSIIARFNEGLNRTQLLKQIDDTTLTTGANRTVAAAVESALESGSRREAAKLLLIITEDDRVEIFANISDVKTVIVLISSTVDKRLLWEVVSSPGCRNSFIVEEIALLSSITDDLSVQFCQARTDEFQAVAVEAYDEEGHRGQPSNVLPFMIQNTPELVVCPELEPPPTPAPATSSVARTVGLAVGIPFTLILSVLGSVMLFGQIKKFRKKQKEKKRRKEEEKRAEQMKEARQRNAAAKAAAAAESGAQSSPDMTDINNKNNNSNHSGGGRKKFWRKCRTAPLHYPPV